MDPTSCCSCFISFVWVKRLHIYHYFTNWLSQMGIGALPILHHRLVYGSTHHGRVLYKQEESISKSKSKSWQIMNDSESSSCKLDLQPLVICSIHSFVANAFFTIGRTLSRSLRCCSLSLSIKDSTSIGLRIVLDRNISSYFDLKMNRWRMITQWLLYFVGCNQYLN